jgi:hypothetical protein
MGDTIMDGRNILFCDDDVERFGSEIGAIRSAIERDGKHNLDLFDVNTIDQKKRTDKDVLAGAICKQMQDISCEGLIMDLKWYQKALGYERNLGMDVLEVIVEGGLMPSLSLDRIVIVTQYPEDPGAKERFLKLNCPEDNWFDKQQISKESARFTAIFE